jgi:membrane-bound lytic murein transglycosylase D
VRYRIQPGDTLGSIAAQYGTTVRDIQAWNHLRGTRIAAGDVLTIYTGTPQD